MAVLPRRPARLQALAWLAVVLLLAATSGCLCRDVPTGGVLPGRALLQSTTAPAPDSPAPPPPPPFRPRPICRLRLCPPRCGPEGCPGNGGSP